MKMKNKITFGSWEGITVLVNLIFVQILLSYSRIMAIYSGSAGWMIPVLSTVIVLIYFSVVASLYKNIGSLDLLDISEKAGGKVLKIVVGILSAIFLFIQLATALGDFSKTLKITSLDKSPLLFVELIFIVGIICSAFFGIEAVVRINAFLLPVVIIGFLLITIGVIPQFDVNNLFPILGRGYISVIKGSLYELSAYSSLIILFFMVPFIKKKYLKRVGFRSIIVSGLLLIWSTLSFLLLYPYQIAVENKIPVFQMAKYIEVGNMFQRIESIFVLISSISALLYLGVFFAFLIHIINKTLSIKKSKLLVIPIAVICLIVSHLLQSMNIDFNSSKVTDIIWLFGLVLPLIIVIIGAVKKVGKGLPEGSGGNE